MSYVPGVTKSAAQQGEPRGTEEQIDVVADELSVRDQGQIVEASGNVQIRRAETTFEAESVRIDRASQDLQAEGSVSVDDPQYKLKASSMNMNLENETATIRDADVFIEKGHLSLSGSRLEKYVGQVYSIEDGLFTTCLCESGRPPWRIGAKEINLEKEGHGTVKDGTFYIYDVPVLYLPYAIFPLQAERSSGFLMPKLGSSSEDGFLYQHPFFWAINKSNDATLNFTVESSSRIGAIGQYRTVLREGTKGEINASYFNESWRTNRSVTDPNLAAPGIPENRWNAVGTHRNKNESGWITHSDVALYSDNLFTRELFDLFDLDFLDRQTVRTSRFSRSQGAFYRYWAGEKSEMKFEGRWAYQQDFIQPQSDTLQGTPHVSFTGRRRLGDTPLEIGWRIGGVSYLREGGAGVVSVGSSGQTTAVKGTDGLRFDVRPELVLPMRLGRYAKWTGSLALRETFYHLYYTGGKYNPSKNDFSGTFARNSSRELAEIRWNLRSSIGRTFNWNGSSLKKIRHVLEPEISYLFIPFTDQSDMPIWDDTDRINRRNLLTFSLTNRFWGKRKADADAPRAPDRQTELIQNINEIPQLQEMARFKLALSFDIDKARNGGDSLSDLDMSARFTPVDWFIMGANLGLDPGRWDVNQAAVGFSVTDPRPIRKHVQEPDFNRKSQLSMSFRYIRRNELSPLTLDANLNLQTDCPNPLNSNCDERDAVNQVRVDALFHLTDRILLLYNSSFDGVSGRFTSNQGGIKYLSKCECWTASLFVNKLINPDRTNIRLGFSLVGLGAGDAGLTQGFGLQ